MDVTIYRDNHKYALHFEKGENVGGLKEELYSGRRTGTITRWKPDLEVFTDIDVPESYFLDTIKRQAIVNAGVTFLFRRQNGSGFETTTFLYENGIADYVKEIAGEQSLTPVQVWQAERKVRDRADKPEYKTKFNVALCFSNRTKPVSYTHLPNIVVTALRSMSDNTTASFFVFPFDAT